MAKAAGTVVADINTYDIVNAEVLLLSEGAAKVFSEEIAPEVNAN
jgi:large subunit ribosomal protein L4